MALLLLNSLLVSLNMYSIKATNKNHASKKEKKKQPPQNELIYGSSSVYSFVIY